MPSLLLRATAAAACVFAAAACTGAPNGGGDESAAPHASAGGADARAELVVAQATVTASGSIPLTLRVINPGADTLTLEFTSGQRFDLRVLRSDGESVYTWSADKLFMQALGQETVAPGDTLAFAETVPAPPEPGTYRIEGSLTASNRDLADTATVTVTP